MVINGTAVLAFGIISVFGVAVLNNHRANATSSARELPRGYLANPATSPIAGFTPAMLPPARPILRSDTHPVAPAVKSDAAFSDSGRRLAFN